MSTGNLNEDRGPLLEDSNQPEAVRRNLIQSAISQTFQSTAHLANLLPTGTVLAFRLLSPILSSEGECDAIGRSLTTGLVVLCGLLCFLLNFTDSLTDQSGNVCYGFATFRGLWLIDGDTTLQPDVTAQYRLKLIDFVHAFMSILVFVAVALFDQNVVNCLYPLPSDQNKVLLEVLPVAIGVICSMFFVTFPTQRHGIGFPVTAT